MAHSDTAASAMEIVRSLLQPALEDGEGRKVRTFLHRDFLFRIDGDAFVLRLAPGQEPIWESGDRHQYEQLRATVIECTRDSINALVRRRVTPSTWLFSGEVYMSGMASAMAYNHALLRLLRRGQELVG